MKILIRNLARTTTEKELKTMFEAHGIVQSCTLIIDEVTGNSKGFGFIEMPKQGDAKAAIKSLNNQDVGGSKIRVKKSEAKKNAHPKKITGASKYRSVKPKEKDNSGE